MIKKSTAVLAIATFLLSLTACSGGGNSSLPGPGLSKGSSSVRSVMSTTDQYSVAVNRGLDNGDDSTWWANGGSGGLISSGGTGCVKSACPQARPVGATPPPKQRGRHTLTLSNSQPMMMMTCWYDNTSGGPRDITRDTFLGCTYEDFYGGTQDFNQTICCGNDDVSIHGGKPNGNAPACSGAPEVVADSFPHNNVIVTVLDVNSLWNGSTNVGWLYHGSDGYLYVQFNYMTQAGYNFAANLGFGSVGQSTPGGYSGIYQTPAKPSGTKAVKCFTEGDQLS